LIRGGSFYMNQCNQHNGGNDAMNDDVAVLFGHPFTGSPQWGYVARVTDDGAVYVWDDMAGHWTTCHSLTPRQIAYVKRRAIRTA
jgi:hypothetical protein